MDPPLRLFRRQYLQLFEPDFLTWPPKQLLKDIDIQAWLYTNLFDDSKNARLPPVRYQVRVLKALIARIEKSIQDPDQDEISDHLLNHFSTLMANPLPSEFVAVQQKTYVTFTCLPSIPQQQQTASHNSPSSTEEDEPTLTLLERPHLISGSQTTGFRTWEASLHLGAYLLRNPYLIQNRSVLELGAGTGFVSLLCAKHLSAAHVTITDGDEGVVEAVRENLFLNGIEEDDGYGKTSTNVEGSNAQKSNTEPSPTVIASVLRWGQTLVGGTWVEEDCEAHPYDIVVGADITYDKPSISALISTLRSLFTLRPNLRIVIAGAVRNADTFGYFQHLCQQQNFLFDEIDFPPTPIHQQTCLFYATACPLKIVEIRKND